MTTLAEYEADLAALRACRTSLLTGAQEYSIGNRRMRKVDLAEINREIARIEGIINELSGYTTNIVGFLGR
jgi:hypothetical protein